jgi:hypothetical protein
MVRRPSVDEQLLAWHWFKFRLPAEWEATSYSASPDKGEIAFQTRRGLEGHVAWQRCRSAPDLKRCLEETLRRETAKAKGGAEATFRAGRAGRFHACWRHDGEPCRAALYLEEERQLVQWRFPCFARDRWESAWRRILESFAPNAGQEREWSIFGVHAALPREFQLTGVAPYPADVCLIFENRGHLRVSLRRWGLPEILLKGRTLPELYRRMLTQQKARVTGASETNIRGMPGAVVEFAQPAEAGWQKLLRRSWPGRCVLWHDGQEKRIHAFEQVGPASQPRLELNDVMKPQ